MLKLTSVQREWIKANIKGGDELMNGELRPLLDAIVSWMAKYAFDSDDEITDEGRKVERMYDSIYDNN